jgi:hypothetical protein
MKYVVLLALLLFGCGDLSVPTDSDWDCSDNPAESHRAFIECVTAMSSTEHGPYTASECEDHARRAFCGSKKAKEDAQLKQAQAETKKVRDELSKTKKLADKYHRQRNVFCATLMGECIMYGVDTKTDRHCEDTCVVDDEDVSKEVDAEIAKKKAEKEE